MNLEPAWQTPRERCASRSGVAADAACCAATSAVNVVVVARKLCTATSIGNQSAVATLDVLVTVTCAKTQAASAWSHDRGTAMLAE
jgi:hypothetical protein